jgi:hypothetical protein
MSVVKADFLVLLAVGLVQVDSQVGTRSRMNVQFIVECENAPRNLQNFQTESESDDGTPNFKLKAM